MKCKRARGDPLAVLMSPGPPGLSSASSLGSLAVHQTTLTTSLLICRKVLRAWMSWTLMATAPWTRAVLFRGLGHEVSGRG